MTLGFSPCPNDTFIFHAMTHGLVDTEGLTFEVLMEDVEQLNQAAFSQKYNITNWSNLEPKIKQKILHYISRQGFSNPFEILNKWIKND